MEYRETIAPYFKSPLQLPGGAQEIEEEIERFFIFYIDYVISSSCAPINLVQ